MEIPNQSDLIQHDAPLRIPSNFYNNSSKKDDLIEQLKNNSRQDHHLRPISYLSAQKASEQDDEGVEANSEHKMASAGKLKEVSFRLPFMSFSKAKAFSEVKETTGLDDQQDSLTKSSKD